MGENNLKSPENPKEELMSIRCKQRFDIMSKYKENFGNNFDNLEFINYETGGVIKGAALRDAKSGCEIYEILGWDKSGFGKTGIHKCGCKGFDEKVRALNSSTGQAIGDVPFFIEAENGKTYSGYTDADGNLPRVFTQNDHEITVYWYDEALAKMEEYPCRS